MSFDVPAQKIKALPYVEVPGNRVRIYDGLQRNARALHQREFAAERLQKRLTTAERCNTVS